MKPLVLLHGALGASSQFNHLRPVLEQEFECYYLDFYGHGGKPDNGHAFSISDFAHQLIEFLDEKHLEKPDVFGFSMGGYVVTYAAFHYPDRIGNIVTLGTKWQWNPEVAAKEVKMLNPDKIAQKVTQFADRLRERHYPMDWKTVTYKTAQMLQTIGEAPLLTDEDFKQVSQNVHLMLGDQDEMVSREETEYLHENLLDSNYLLLEDTQHPLEKVDPYLIRDKLVGLIKS